MDGICVPPDDSCLLSLAQLNAHPLLQQAPQPPLAQLGSVGAGASGGGGGGTAFPDGAAAGVAYEVRIYSLEPGPGFGAVLQARPVRAAHCLTSIQFSPTSQHLLLAYGRHAHTAGLLLSVWVHAQPSFWLLVVQRCPRLPAKQRSACIVLHGNGESFVHCRDVDGVVHTSQPWIVS